MATSSEQTEPVTSDRPDRWGRMNHEWSAPPDDGYAVCSQCLCRENSRKAAEPCEKGPVMQWLVERLIFRLGRREFPSD